MAGFSMPYCFPIPGNAEKQAIKHGKTAEEIWPDQPAGAARKDTGARWTEKFSRTGMQPDDTKHTMDISIPASGYKRHIVVDRCHVFIRFFVVTDAAGHDGRIHRDIVRKDNNTGPGTRDRVEHVSDTQKTGTGLCIRSGGIRRPEAKITLCQSCLQYEAANFPPETNDDRTGALGIRNIARIKAKEAENEHRQICRSRPLIKNPEQKQKFRN